MRKIYPLITSAFLLGVVSFALFVFGCSKQEAPSFRGAPTKMVIGAPKGESAAVVYALEYLGYGEKLGIEVEVREFDSGVAAVKALNEGRIDLAVASDFVFAGNVEQHQDLRIIAAINSCTNTYMLARKDRGIGQPGDLKGKRIAVTRTSISDYLLGKYLNSSRLRINEVTIVDMSPTLIEKELTAGTVDAAIIWDPFARRIKERLGPNGLSWSAQAESPYLMVLIGRNGFIEKEPAAMVGLLRGLIMVEKALAADPGPVQRHLAQRFAMSESYFADVWGDNRFKVNLDRRLMLSLEEESRWIHKVQGASAPWTPNFLLYLYFEALTVARPESVTIVH